MGMEANVRTLSKAKECLKKEVTGFALEKGSPFVTADCGHRVFLYTLGIRAYFAGPTLMVYLTCPTCDEAVIASDEAINGGPRS